MNPIVIDLIIAAIVVIAALRGRHKGLVLTLCGLLTVFMAFLGACIVSSLLAEPVAGLLYPVVEEAVLAVLSRGISDPPTAPTEFPLFTVLNALHHVPFFAGLVEMFQSALESGAVELTGSAALAVAQFAAVQLSRILIFLITFMVIVILWWVISHALDLAFHLPGLNFLNRTGGLLFGLVQGLALVYILCWLFRDSYITPDLIDGSALLPYFCGENPLANISILNS